MRIALISELYLGGVHGVARLLYSLCEGLPQRGHQVLFLGPRGGKENSPGVEFHTYPGLPLPIYPELKAAIPLRDMRDKVCQFSPDVVHMVHPIWFAARGMQYAKELGLPTVASFHSRVDIFARYYWPTRYFQTFVLEYTRYVFNQADLVLCPTPSTQQDLLHKGIKHTQIWGRGVDIQSFNPQRYDNAWRQSLLGSDRQSLLLFVGRLAREKNVQFLRDVALSLPQTRLVIVGDGPDRKRLEKWFTGSGAVFTGYLQGDALYKTYACADLFVFPSLTETYGQVVCEAMSSGVPVVAFDALGVRDLIINWQNGILCDREEEFIMQTKVLLENPIKRSALAERASGSVKSRTWNQILDQLVSYYQQAIDKNRFPISEYQSTSNNKGGFAIL